MSPYLLKSKASKEFVEQLNAKSNYSFGGKSPLQQQRRQVHRTSQNQQRTPNSVTNGRKYIIDKNGLQIVKNNLYNRGVHPVNTNNFQSLNALINPTASIYDLVSQEINVPEGLLYRGKYCGKSKLRQKEEEYGQASVLGRSKSNMGQMN